MTKDSHCSQDQNNVPFSPSYDLTIGNKKSVHKTSADYDPNTPPPKSGGLKYDYVIGIIEKRAKSGTSQ